MTTTTYVVVGSTSVCVVYDDIEYSRPSLVFQSVWRAIMVTQYSFRPLRLQTTPNQQFVFSVNSTLATDANQATKLVAGDSASMTIDNTQ